MKKEAQQIVQEVFYNMSKMYESIFTSYYPSHGSNGFTERNITFYFSHFYLKNANNLSDIIIWQEVPIKGGEHFDTMIIDTVNEMIFIIEAKRLQNKGKFESIKDDFEKIIQKNNQIKIPYDFTIFDKYAILLTDIWVPENNNMKITLQKDFSNIFIDNYLKEPVGIGRIEIENIKKIHSAEEYWLMYNLYELEINSNKCP